MTRVAVLGATGMNGHAIALYLEKNGFEVYRMARGVVSSARNASIDATDIGQLIDWLKRVNPEYIVNAIGILPAVAQKRPDLAIVLNAYLPQHLARVYEDSRTRLIQLSTDCVFSGSLGKYTEESVPDGRNVYDRTKALGEIVNGKDLTFRVSTVGPELDSGGVGLFNWFMRQSGEIQGYSHAMWNGITTMVLGRGVASAIEQGLKGLYHLAPAGGISKHDLLCMFNQEFRGGSLEIVPVDRISVDKTLVNTRDDFEFAIPSYPEMLREMGAWMNMHEDVYPHYARSLES